MQLTKLAAVMSDELKQAVKQANTESDIRTAFDKQIGQIESETGYRFSSKAEYRVVTGRIDAVYNGVFIEFKNPSDPTSRIGRTRDTNGTPALIKQIKSRFKDIESQLGYKPFSILGIGLDGRRIIFVRHVAGEWYVEEPRDVDASSIKRILLAVRNLESSGKSFTPENLTADFGPESNISGNLIKSFYNALTLTDDPQTNALFEEWKLIYQIIAGIEPSNFDEYIEDIGNLYGVELHSAEDGVRFLYAIHTYYAFLMKCISAEIICYHHSIPSPIRKIATITKPQNLKQHVRDIEEGSVFRHLHINNFLEGDLFAWYVNQLNQEITDSIQSLVSTLTQYQHSTIGDATDKGQDLLRELYLSMVPRSLRHKLGEYYTPDWLAELALTRVGYDGDVRKRVVDPACGSGTFLVAVLTRAKQWYELNRFEADLGPGDFLQLALENIVGFDLNPIAVLAARTNILISLSEYIPEGAEIFLPVYLCDSIVSPVQYSDLFSGDVLRVPCGAMQPPFLNIPREVAESQEIVNRYCDDLEESVSTLGYFEEFYEKIEEYVNVTDSNKHKSLFNDLRRLKKERKDSVWVRFIRNAFAPLLMARFDYVVGNPPWVGWQYLLESYRESSEEIWEHYGLVGHTLRKRRQASRRYKTDLSVLLTYVSLDRYLKNKGRLAFVLPRTLLETETGGWFFRKFALPDGCPVAVQHVDDVDGLRPFAGQATNFSAVISFRKGMKTRYPVKVDEWTRKKSLTPSDSLETMLSSSEKKRMFAKPVDATDSQSQWLFAARDKIEYFAGLVGESPYYEQAREGVNTRGANGIFFVDAAVKYNKLFISNRMQDGANRALEPFECAVEPEFVYPLLDGRNVSPFEFKVDKYILLPHSPKNATTPVSWSDIGPGTRKFLLNFKGYLQSRKKFRNFDPSSDQWYGLYSVLRGTFFRYKVVWREISNKIVAAPVSEGALPSGVMKPVIPDHKLFIIPVESWEEALYLSGLLNSRMINELAATFVVETGISVHILQKLPIPRYDEVKHGDFVSEVSEIFEKDGWGVGLAKKIEEYAPDIISKGGEPVL